MPMISAGGIRLHYHLQGSGATIVFLHPPCIGSRVFTYLLNDLSRDHRTLLFDLRGHGQSPKSETPLTISLLAEDACRLMDALDISKAYLCAYSSAALIAMEAMLSHPDRFLGAALLSGIIQASGSKSGWKLWFGSLAARMKAKEILVLPQLWSNSDNIYTYRNLRRETSAGDLANWRQYMDSALRHSVTERLREIRRPVLMICGDKDQEARRQARIMQQALPYPSTAFLAGMKHTLPTHAADSAGAVIRDWIRAGEGAVKKNTANRPDDWNPGVPYRQDGTEEIYGHPEM